MKEGLLFVARIMLPFIAAVALIYYLGAGGLIGAFMKNDSIIAHGTRFLRGFCLGLPFICMDFLAVGVFQAIGLGRAALLFAVLRKIVLEIPALYILNFLFPLRACLCSVYGGICAGCSSSGNAGKDFWKAAERAENLEYNNICISFVWPDGEVHWPNKRNAYFCGVIWGRLSLLKAVSWLRGAVHSFLHRQLRKGNQ